MKTMWWAALVSFAGCIGAMGQTNVTSFTVTPTALSFAAIDPDAGGPAAQSSTAVTRLTNTGVLRPWTLYVESETATLAGCAHIPASALVVTCTTATADSSNSSGKAYCNSSPVPVSTSRSVIANGAQGNRDVTITVGFQVSFADSWRYQAVLAPACTVSLRYTVDAP